MKKCVVPGILAVLFLFLPLRSQAVPLDVPYQTVISSVNTGSIIVSTTTFPNGNTSVNSNIANAQWCITHLQVSSGLNSTLTIAYSTAPFTQPLTTGTTDFKVVTSTAVIPYDEIWPYRTPYCAPIGQTVVTITSSVAAAIIHAEGYLFKGWNP